jgi:hypothetical protein
VAFLAPGPLAAQSSSSEPEPAGPGRGPASVRDEQLLAQPRLTLPAVSPRTTAAGRWVFEVATLWSSSFSWTQDVPGENPEHRSFLVDGEALTLDARIRRGLTPRLDVGLRLPLRGRGGGALDGFIDWWHRVFGAPNGNRPDFLKNAFRVEGLTTAGRPFSWNDEQGTGAGDLEIDGRWRLTGTGRTPSAALVARVSLPTGTGPFAGNGVGGALQLVGQAPLGRRFDAYFGAGLTLQDPGPVRGVAYETARVQAFAAVEWRLGARLSLVAETNAASRLVANVERYPGFHWVVNVVGRLDVGAKGRLDLGITENILNQQVTTDFALYVALSVRP